MAKKKDKSQIMVMFLDDGGAPRAWAAASDEATAEREAYRQLELYCNKKRALGEAASVRDFTKDVRKVAG